MKKTNIYLIFNRKHAKFIQIDKFHSKCKTAYRLVLISLIFDKKKKKIHHGQLEITY